MGLKRPLSRAAAFDVGNVEGVLTSFEQTHAGGVASCTSERSSDSWVSPPVWQSTSSRDPGSRSAVSEPDPF